MGPDSTFAWATDQGPQARPSPPSPPTTVLRAFLGIFGPRGTSRRPAGSSGPSADALPQVLTCDRNRKSKGDKPERRRARYHLQTYSGSSCDLTYKSYRQQDSPKPAENHSKIRNRRCPSPPSCSRLKRANGCLNLPEILESGVTEIGNSLQSGTRGSAKRRRKYLLLRVWGLFAFCGWRGAIFKFSVLFRACCAARF